MSLFFTNVIRQITTIICQLFMSKFNILINLQVVAFFFENVKMDIVLVE